MQCLAVSIRLWQALAGDSYISGDTYIPILISLYKAQVQVDQGPPHKTRYIETYRGESGEEPRTHGHKGKIPSPFSF